MNKISITLPLTNEIIKSLKVKDMVLLNGTIYTARDAAHAKIKKLIDDKKPLPFPLAGNIIYYTGPSPTIPGMVVGSIGPTTSKRMDIFTPELLSLGLKATIGKGERSNEVIDGIRKYQAIYFAATGGTGVLLSQSVESIECIAFEELGPEAIYKLKVNDFPVIVAIDCLGNTIF